jgi:NADPH:quinone reductase-like Zn-dependent oxidoreductase
MRAWAIEKNFGLDHLKMVNVAEKPIKDDQVNVNIRACSLNFRDLMVVKGQYNPKQLLPLIPLSDGAGDVVEIGKNVTKFKVGDKVCTTFSQKWCHGVASSEAFLNTLGSPLDGTLRESSVFREDGLIKFPKHLSYEEAATLPCAGVTAFNAIAFQSKLKPGDTVLLEGTGGVSIFALQFAKAFGLKSIVISSSDEKLKQAKQMSATHGINYLKIEDWPQAILELTDGLGVDAVVEVGGAKTLSKAIRSVKKGGVVCVIGILSGSKEPLDLRPILMNNIRLQGIFVGAKTVFDAMNRVICHANIHPIVDRIFDFDEAKKAFYHLESAQHFGKVSIKIS